MNWINNTSGKPDAILTLSVAGFLVVIMKLLVAGSTLVIGANSYAFGDINASEITAILTPTLGAYVARRYTDKKFKEEEGK